MLCCKAGVHDHFVYIELFAVAIFIAYHKQKFAVLIVAMGNNFSPMQYLFGLLANLYVEKLCHNRVAIQVHRALD